MSTRIQGLYVIIDPDACDGRAPVDVAQLALEGGASIIQWRDKRRAKGDQLADASAIRTLCETHGAAFVVNDHADLAVAVHADGVHLGQHDLGVAAVRPIVGNTMLVGVSTNTLEEAARAEAEGADYIAVGSVFPTGSKDNTRPASLMTLREIKRAVYLPVVAIGGIGVDNIAAVIANGADAVAVISAVCAASDPRAAANQLARAFAAVERPRVGADRMRAIVDDYVNTINDRDRERFVALFAPDGIREDPSQEGIYIGREAIGRNWDDLHLADRPFQIRVHNIVVVRQEAALFWTIAHQHDDGDAALASGVEIIGVEDNGEIASARAYWSRDAAPGSTPRAVAEATVAALNAKDRTAYVDLWARDGMWQAPFGQTPTIGVDNIRAACDSLFAAQAGLTIRIDAVCASGAEAALAWTSILKGRKRERTVSGVDVITLDDEGKIAALNSYWEPEAIANASERVDDNG